jgi:hypothetical protein
MQRRSPGRSASRFDLALAILYGKRCKRGLSEAFRRAWAFRYRGVDSAGESP